MGDGDDLCARHCSRILLGSFSSRVGSRGSVVSLTSATSTDASWCFELRCDPAVNLASFRIVAPKNATDYMQWFRVAVASTSMSRIPPHNFPSIFIIRSDTIAAGVGCITIETVNAQRIGVLSVMLKKAWRNQSIGQTAITLLSDQCVRQYECDIVAADIKHTNSASLIAFLRAGFVLHSPYHPDHNLASARWVRVHY